MDDAHVMRSPLVLGDHGPGWLALFSELVNRSERYVRRIVETVELSDVNLLRHIQLDLVLPSVAKADSPEASYLVPLFARRRGNLTDSVSLSPGCSLLSQAENKHLAGLLLIYLFNRYITTQLGTDSVPTEDVKKISGRLMQIPATESEAESLAIWHEVLSDADALGIGRGLRNSALHSRVVFLSQFYLVTCEVQAKPSQRLSLSYTYASRVINSQYVTTNDFRRVYLGARPYSVRIHVTKLFNCDSYHFKMIAPDGQYLNSQQLVNQSGGVIDVAALKSRPNITPQPARYQCSKPGGDRAHIYNGNLSGYQRQPVYVETSFYEIPPGTLQAAAASSFALANLALVSFISYAALRTGGAPAVAAAIVAIPGAIAIWAQQGFRTSSALQAPLSARFGSVGVLTLSFSDSLALSVGSAIAHKNPVYEDFFFYLLMLISIGSIALFIRLAIGARRALENYQKMLVLDVGIEKAFPSIRLLRRRRNRSAN